MSQRAASNKEFLRRCANAQLLMLEAEPPVDVLMLSTEVDVSYFTGLDSQFWHSPTRPICVLIPKEGPAPIAIVPDIMRVTFEATCAHRVVTWSSIQETVVETLVRELRALAPSRYQVRVITPMNTESHVRIPLMHLNEIASQGIVWCDGSPIVHEVRLIKSPHEINCVRRACEIGSQVLHNLPIPPVLTEREFARSVKIAMLKRGADTAPFVVITSGRNGYVSIVNGPTDRTLERGDVMTIDVGCTYAGYWCDFNRNYAFGEASPAAMEAHRILWDATERALESIAGQRQTFGGLWEILKEYCLAKGGDPSDYETGRMGHGLGRTLTELPSVAPGEETILEAGMVLTLEPCLRIENSEEIMVHEECIVITESGYSLLTERAPRELMVLDESICA